MNHLYILHSTVSSGLFYSLNALDERNTIYHMYKSISQQCQNSGNSEARSLATGTYIFQLERQECTMNEVSSHSLYETPNDPAVLG